MSQDQYKLYKGKIVSLTVRVATISMRLTRAHLKASYRCRVGHTMMPKRKRSAPAPLQAELSTLMHSEE